ncbi:MAG: PAC2 family protein [Chloroflexota bacterium]
MNEAARVFRRPRLKNPSVIVGWAGGGGQMSGEVVDHLITRLQARPFAEIEPVGFFPLGGVSVEGSVARFPDSTFYAYPKGNLILFRSTPPGNEWSRFLEAVLDVAGKFGQVRELYTVGAMVSMSAHTVPRQLVGVFNSPHLQQSVGEYGFARPLDYETPSGQRPTVSSFLVWTAARRRVQAASLWVPVPFYLLPLGDPKSKRKLLDFLSWRLELGLDLRDMDEEIDRKDRALARLRTESPNIDSWMSRLEAHQVLSDEERQRLVQELASALAEDET